MMQQGTVTSAAECRPIAGVSVSALNEMGQVLAVATSDAAGAWKLARIDGLYDIQFQKPGFATRTVSFADLQPCVRLMEERIVGYQNKLWFHPGERAQIFVHAPARYRAGLFRHGACKDGIMDLGENPAQCREAPDSAWVADGLPWSPSWEYTLPATLRPGLYSLALEMAEQKFAIPMVVSTPPKQRGRRAKLAVLASTPTWQAYNFYGGRNKYQCCEERFAPASTFVPSRRYHLKQCLKNLVPARLRHWLRRRMTPPAPNWQTQPLSVRRPFPNSGLDADHPDSPFTNHLAGGEWRLLAWLEREGIEYDLIAGEELHACPDALAPYRAVVLNTHCEYVSREMHTALCRFHFEQGGWLLNLAGNSLYCEVELTENAVRFVGGLFMDTCADETQLLGVRFTRNDIGTCAPYRIVKPAHWAFAGLRLAPNRIFGNVSLNQDTPRESLEIDPSRPGDSPGLTGHGASGWETDKLSATAPKDVVVIAKGMNAFGGADMVVREPAGSRGGMFSASSIVFPGCLLVDAAASGIVKNVLRRASVVQGEATPYQRAG